jgi:hypothetical protein
MVKIVFQSDASLRNYREKIEEIKVDACMSACVRWQACSRKGFYAATNWF